jgi:hypothetical protein
LFFNILLSLQHKRKPFLFSTDNAIIAEEDLHLPEKSYLKEENRSALYSNVFGIAFQKPISGHTAISKAIYERKFLHVYRPELAERPALLWPQSGP